MRPKLSIFSAKPVLTLQVVRHWTHAFSLAQRELNRPLARERFSKGILRMSPLMIIVYLVFARFL
jgi:hypothetical protein